MQGAMRITSILALAATLLLMLAAPLKAGTVNVGLLKDSDMDKWFCDPSVSQVNLPADFRFASTEIQQCSTGYSVLVANGSDLPVKVDVEFSGKGFSEEMHPGLFMSAGPLNCDSASSTAKRFTVHEDPCVGYLQPNLSCTERVQFCPDQSGTSLGQVKVITGEGSKAQTTTFNLIGDAIYSPELQAADEARRRHLDELMKIPHVVKVELDPRDSDIFINLKVEEDASLDKVRRAAPPKIEGYDVEVTRNVEVFWGD
jgi:hypothetical protein